MKRATRTNLILVGFVAALGFAAYWQVGKEIAGFEPPLSALNPETIEHVRVACLQCIPRRFERIDGHWMMREPYNLPADDAQVARLLSIAAAPVRSRRAFASLDAKKIGLNPALISLDLDTVHFDIGTTDAFNGDRYVRIGDTIAMAPDRFSPFLVAAPASELDRHLLPRGSVLTSLKINAIDQPDLIEAWTGALAERITASSSSTAGATDAIVDMQLDDGTAISYRIVRKGDVVVARRSEPALSYTLSPGQAIDLLGEPQSSAH